MHYLSASLDFSYLTPRYTVQVNNQMVVGTLMNICDAPNQVSIGQTWREGDWVRRIPIIVTGNDFSKVFAPLVREGRMARFYWQPEREELMAILHQMYKVWLCAWSVRRSLWDCLRNMVWRCHSSLYETFL